MGTSERSKASSDRQNWTIIYDSLVEMLKTQQTQLETIAKEKELLEDRIRLQHHRWLSDFDLFQDKISKVKGDFAVKDMAASLEAAKSDLFMGLKQRQAYLSKLKLEDAESELGDFKELLKLLCNKSIDPKGHSKSLSTTNVEQRPENLESETRRLKQEYDKLALEKNSEISALLAEKNFVWNQYKVLENECASKLQSKTLKVEQAEEKVQALIASMEHLQSSNDRKEDKVIRLTKQLTKMKEESEKFKEETCRLSKELDLLRKSINVPVITPVLNRCTTRTTRTSNSKGKQNDRNTGILVQRKESTSSAQAASGSTEGAGKGSKRSKRIGDHSATTLESPKLFSASFKVPKLKNVASTVRL